MRLIDLEPSFIGSGGDGVTDKDGNPVPYRPGVGVMCNCPCGCTSWLYVPFENPLDGGPPLEPDKRHNWKRVGDTFETLTLTPSILRVKWKDTKGVEHGCGWHGYITNGEIIRC